jgi:hypothetical protein
LNPGWEWVFVFIHPLILIYQLRHGRAGLLLSPAESFFGKLVGWPAYCELQVVSNSLELITLAGCETFTTIGIPFQAD